MYKLQMKFQGIITYLCLAAAALTFAYSLGVCTDLYSIRSIQGIADAFLIEIPGIEVYDNIQPFNKAFTSYSVVLILLCAVSFLVNNHKRRKYYFANYFTTVLSSSANIFVAVWALINVFKYKAEYLKVDYSALSVVDSDILSDIGVDLEKLMAKPSTFWLDISVAVLAILVIVSLLNIANMFFKIYVMKAERKLLGEGA